MQNNKIKNGNDMVSYAKIVLPTFPLSSLSWPLKERVLNIAKRGHGPFWHCMQIGTSFP